MAAKTEAKEAPAPAEKEKPAAAPAAAPAPKAGLAAWLPAIVVAVVAPAGSWAVAQYVLLPTLQKKLLQGSPAAEIASGDASKNANSGKSGPAEPPTYGFDNVVVNLAGTMGTRYLKTSFVVTGSDAAMHSVFDANKVKLTDVTLNVLSSLTMADLEEPGSKNVLREKLVGAYNQALGRKLAEQVYFSDFVVQ